MKASSVQTAPGDTADQIAISMQAQLMSELTVLEDVRESAMVKLLPGKEFVECSIQTTFDVFNRDPDQAHEYQHTQRLIKIAPGCRAQFDYINILDSSGTYILQL